ncbi:hypothetical protein IFM89_027439, partial [Coptis chinensis]
MAKEKGVPVSSITRLDQYMHNHKRKNGEHQDPELVEKLNDYTALHPESRETSVNDAPQRGCFEAWVKGPQNIALLREFMSQGRMPMADVESPRSSHASRRLEEGNFKVHVNVVYDGGAVLPLPHDDWRSKLGEGNMELLYVLHGQEGGVTH